MYLYLIETRDKDGIPRLRAHSKSGHQECKKHGKISSSSGESRISHMEEASNPDVGHGSNNKFLAKLCQKLQ